MNNFNVSPMPKNKTIQSSNQKMPKIVINEQKTTSTKRVATYFNAHGVPSLGRVLKKVEHNLVK